MHSGRFYASILMVGMWLIVGLALSAFACGSGSFVGYSYKDIDVGGVGVSFIHLPISPDSSLQCVQGAGGGYSHGGVSTRYDLDLDTSNILDEPLYAPVSGIAHVHTESSKRNFGYHVNIDLGDGKYVVIAHMSKILVEDQSEIVEGQFIGYEGCTGSCTGDHVHIGLHKGDASEKAEFGRSVPAHYLIADHTAPRGYKTLQSDKFVCGLKSFGDNENGLFYSSALSNVMFHPNGTLVKIANNSKVYRINDGELVWIENEHVFRSQNYSFNDVVVISEDELSCYENSGALSGVGKFDAVFDMSGQLWLMVGGPRDVYRYRIAVHENEWDVVLATWGIYFDQEVPRSLRDSHVYFQDWQVRNGFAKFRDGSLVKENGMSTIYVISDGAAVPISDWNTYLLLGFENRNVLTVNPGILNVIQQSVGNCGTSSLCLDTEAVVVCGGTFDGLNVTEVFVDSDFVHDSVGSDGSVVATKYQSGQSGVDNESISQRNQGLCNQDLCLVDLNNDGLRESLFMSDSLWKDDILYRMPAYVYSEGNCFTGEITDFARFVTSLRVDGYYVIDFSRFNYGCSSRLTLISSLGTDQCIPDTWMSNWNWWNTHDACSDGIQLCNLMNNGSEWEDWLISVSWNVETGLFPDGNGFISNNQL